MIADSFEINGQEVEIHIACDANDDCFCIFAQNQNDEPVTGFEFRVKKIAGLDEASFSLSAPAFAIISFMRRQIEENHWLVYQDAGAIDPYAAEVLHENPREAGRQSFLQKIHYRHNPFTDLNRASHDEWDQGWAGAAQKNPAMFDFNTDSFQ